MAAQNAKTSPFVFIFIRGVFLLYICLLYINILLILARLYYEQNFIIPYFVAFDVLLAGRLVTYTWNQACRTSEVYRFIERVSIWNNIVAAFRGMHMSPAKHRFGDYQESVTTNTQETPSFLECLKDPARSLK